MKRYEYLIKYTSDLQKAFKDGLVKTGSEYLTSFGSEGWELFLVNESPGGTSWYFRRELPEPT